MPFSAGAVAFATAFVTVALLLTRFARIAVDRPNERSLHARPVPRTGGIGVLLGAAAGASFGAQALWLPAMAAAVLATISLVDDVRGVSKLLRLGAHLAAAAVVCGGLLGMDDPLAVGLAALAVAWLTNLYNFMDGSDGLAAGMTIVGFSAYAIAAGPGQPALATLSTCLSAAAAAFLVFNFAPARIFLGDVGSVPLGFLAAALGLVGWRDGIWPLWFPMLVFAPFIGDATLTLAKRALRGEAVWLAHREHYYQRLVRMGAGHRGTALLGYALMLACAAAALYARQQAPQAQAMILGAGLLVLAAVAAWIDLRWARQSRSGGAAT